MGTLATRSNLLSVDTTLDEDITATQNYIPVASTANFSTSVVAEVETTNEVVSFSDISENLFEYSEQFDNSYWNKTGADITANQIIAPDGTLTGDKLISTTVAGVFVSKKPATATQGQPYTVSIYAKAGDTDSVRITNVSSGATGAWFDLTNGTIGTQNDASSTGMVSTITDVGDGWYKCTRTFPDSIGDINNWFLFGLNSADGATTGPPVGEFIYIWGAQVENGTTLSTYLPTTSDPLVGLTGVTRGVNGTTAASASSGASIQQLPFALGSLNLPLRLKGLSVSSDGTGAGRLTLCDKVGDTICDIDIPDTKLFDLDFGGGIFFPNGIFISNSINITAYTFYTDYWGIR